MPKVPLYELRRHLAAKSRESLIDDIVELFKRHRIVQEFYAAQLGGVYRDDLLKQYADTLEHEFFPPKGIGAARLSIARRVVTEYMRIAPSPEAVAEIMLRYVELGVRYTNTYGDIDAPFYASMERMFADALKHMTTHNLRTRYHARCRQIADATGGIGWGFNDTMLEIYYDYFND